jgi:hypothetical protein
MLADGGNASRARRLAALHADARLEAFVRFRTTLPGEAGALTAVAGQRTAFEHLASHGSEEDRTTVVLRLRNLLVDPVTVALLAEKGPGWIDEAKRRFASVATDSAEQAREHEVRATVERHAREAAEAQAAAAREAQAAAERRLEEQRLREEADRARSRVVSGSREAIVKRVQAAIEEMVRTKPAGAELRVRIVIDEVEANSRESGTS